MAEKQFTNEDHLLFNKIAIDIKNNPPKYYEAGKWLDEYYSEREYWNRRKIEFKCCNAFTDPNAPVPELLVANSEFMENQEKRKKELELLLRKKEKPPLSLRLRDAWIGIENNCLFTTFLSDKEAKIALLITWLLTDPDASNTKIKLTQFQNWPWGFELDMIGDLTQIRGGLARSWWLNTKRNWGANQVRFSNSGISTIRYAWEKLEAKKKLTQQKSAGTGQKSNTETKQGNMVVSEEKIKQEHRDFLRTIANEVYELVRNSTNMACFRKQVKLFYEKNEEHQREIDLLEKASLADSKLQKAIKKKKEEGNSIIPDSCSFNPKKLEGFENYVFHHFLKDCDGIYKRYGGFWGHPAKTPDLCGFLTPPPERYGPNSFYWLFEYSKQPDYDEKLICSYALLTCIHDIQISEKPVFSAKMYKGDWSLCNKWKYIVWGDLSCDGWDAAPYDLIEALSDTRAWIQRALGDVKENLTKISQRKTEQENGTPAEKDNSFEICSQKDFDSLISIHNRFSQFLKDPEKNDDDDLWEDIENCWPLIEKMGEKHKIPLSGKLQIIFEILEQPELTHPKDI